MTLRNFSSTAAQTTLSNSVDGSATTLTVSATTGFPATPFILAVDAGAAGQELVLVTNVAGTTLTVSRGYDSTVAVAHDTGAVVAHSHGAIDFREANTHVNATSGVHGVTGDLVGTSGAQTLTNKTLTSPTITTPSISSPTVTGSLANIGGAWTAWTPTINSGGAIGNATRTGGWRQIGKDTAAWGRITLGSSTTVTGPLVVSLPASMKTGAKAWVDVELVDGGSTTYFARGVVSGGSLSIFFTGTTGAAGNTSATVPFTWVAGDEINYAVAFEGA